MYLSVDIVVLSLLKLVTNPASLYATKSQWVVQNKRKCNHSIKYTLLLFTVNLLNVDMICCYYSFHIIKTQFLTFLFTAFLCCPPVNQNVC